MSKSVLRLRRSNGISFNSSTLQVQNRYMALAAFGPEMKDAPLPGSTKFPSWTLNNAPSAYVSVLIRNPINAAKRYKKKRLKLAISPSVVLRYSTE